VRTLLQLRLASDRDGSETLRHRLGGHTAPRTDRLCLEQVCDVVTVHFHIRAPRAAHPRLRAPRAALPRPRDEPNRLGLGDAPKAHRKVISTPCCFRDPTASISSAMARGTNPAVAHIGSSSRPKLVADTSSEPNMVKVLPELRERTDTPCNSWWGHGGAIALPGLAEAHDCDVGTVD
jgi:hypothetical protein